MRGSGQPLRRFDQQRQAAGIVDRAVADPVLVGVLRIFGPADAEMVPVPQEQQRTAFRFRTGDPADHVVRQIGTDPCLGTGTGQQVKIDDSDRIPVRQQLPVIAPRLPDDGAELVRTYHPLDRCMILDHGQARRAAREETPVSGPLVRLLQDHDHPDRPVPHQLPLARPKVGNMLAFRQRRERQQDEFSADRQTGIRICITGENQRHIPLFE